MSAKNKQPGITLFQDLGCNRLIEPSVLNICSYFPLTDM